MLLKICHVTLSDYILMTSLFVFSSWAMGSADLRSERLKGVFLGGPNNLGIYIDGRETDNHAILLSVSQYFGPSVH